MADVQLEHGYLRLANELAEALARARLGGTAHRIVWAVLRETFGRPGSPRVALLSARRIAKMIGSSSGRVSEILLALVDARILTDRPAPNGLREIALQKDHDLWFVAPSPKTERCSESGEGSPKTERCSGWVSAPSPKTERMRSESGEGSTLQPKPRAALRAPNTMKTSKTLCARSARGEKSPPDSRVKAFIDGWAVDYSATFPGEKATIAGAKDGKLVKDRLRVHALEELNALRATYFEAVRAGDAFLGDGATISRFLSATVFEKVRALRRKGGAAAPANGNGAADHRLAAILAALHARLPESTGSVRFREQTWECKWSSDGRALVLRNDTGRLAPDLPFLLRDELANVAADDLEDAIRKALDDAEVAT